MGKEWNEIIRNKMEGHEKNPPEGLWEGISEQMGLAQPPARTKPMTRRWYYGAAAAILALAGFFVFYDPQTVEESPLAEVANPVSDRVTPVEDVVEATGKSSQPTPYYNNRVAAPLLAKANIATPVMTEDVPDEIPEDAVATEKLAETVNPQAEEAEKEREGTDNRQVVGQSRRGYDQPAYQSYTPASSSSTVSSDRWSVALKASGGLLAANTSEQTKPIYYDNTIASDENSGYNDVIPAYGKKIKPFRMTERVADHHLPVQVGLSVHYQLNEKTALLSGINYTYLYSKFNVPLYENGEYEQKLRYLGVPFGVARQLWNKNRFYLYASAGVMLEKCLNDEPWQWSVNGAVGVEYRMSKQVGFYLEPSLGYYFDDGTSLEHYFKEHPLTPSLEFGLRMHLNK